MSAILEFFNVVRSFERGKPVLNGVTFTMQPGEVVGKCHDVLNRRGSDERPESRGRQSRGAAESPAARSPFGP